MIDSYHGVTHYRSELPRWSYLLADVLNYWAVLFLHNDRSQAFTGKTTQSVVASLIHLHASLDDVDDVHAARAIANDKSAVW